MTLIWNWKNIHTRSSHVAVIIVVSFFFWYLISSWTQKFLFTLSFFRSSLMSLGHILAPALERLEIYTTYVFSTFKVINLVAVCFLLLLLRSIKLIFFGCCLHARTLRRLWWMTIIEGSRIAALLNYSPQLTSSQLHHVAPTQSPLIYFPSNNIVERVKKKLVIKKSWYIRSSSEAFYYTFRFLHWKKWEAECKTWENSRNDCLLITGSSCSSKHHHHMTLFWVKILSCVV